MREDSPLHEARDLIGKKIAMNTVGAHTEFMTREWLRRKGLKEEEIKQVVLVSVPPASAEQLVRTHQVEVAALAGPIRDKALIQGGLRLLFSDRELYGDFTSGAYVVRKEFAKRNPNATRKLASGIGKAIEWARTQPRDSVIHRLQGILARRGRNETDSIVRYWKSPGIIARDGRLKDQDFQVWIEFLARSGEIQAREIRPSDIYTNAFNGQETKRP